MCKKHQPYLGNGLAPNRQASSHYRDHYVNLPFAVTKPCKLLTMSVHCESLCRRFVVNYEIIACLHAGAGILNLEVTHTPVRPEVECCFCLK